MQTFDVPTEFAGCAVSHREAKMLLTPDDGTDLYALDMLESTDTPNIEVIGESSGTLTGISVYSSIHTDYIFAAQTNVVAVYDFSWNQMGSFDITGLEDVEIQGLSIHQASTEKFSKGVFSFALEAEDFQGFGLSSLEGVLGELEIEPNTRYHPGSGHGCRRHNPINETCSLMGFFKKSDMTCDCFAGTAGDECDSFTCIDDCSAHGTCIGPNTCECDPGWGGLHCSFLLVQPLHETEANGADGDDPAIWVSSKSPELSRIITTTKTDQGAGLGVFDLSGKELQVHYSEQPNNVDIIYGFQAGNRTVDLAYAACRGDNTLW